MNSQQLIARVPANSAGLGAEALAELFGLARATNRATDPSEKRALAEKLAQTMAAAMAKYFAFKKFPWLMNILDTSLFLRFCNASGFHLADFVPRK